MGDPPEEGLDELRGASTSRKQFRRRPEQPRFQRQNNEAFSPSRSLQGNTHVPSDLPSAGMQHGSVSRPEPHPRATPERERATAGSASSLRRRRPPLVHVTHIVEIEEGVRRSVFDRRRPRRVQEVLPSRDDLLPEQASRHIGSDLKPFVLNFPKTNPGPSQVFTAAGIPWPPIQCHLNSGLINAMATSQNVLRDLMRLLSSSACHMHDESMPSIHGRIWFHCAPRAIELFFICFCS